MLNPDKKSPTDPKTANPKPAADLPRVKPGMPVLCSLGAQYGIVDHIDGIAIKLRKDDKGLHHYIPMSWVARVDDSVHSNRPAEQIRREWTTDPPKASRA